MDKAGFTKIILLVFFVVAVVLVYSIFINRSEAPTPAPAPTLTPVAEEVELTRADVLSLLGYEIIDSQCLAEGVAEQYRSCRVDMVEQNGSWSVAVVYDGLYDDSVRASKLQTSITRQGEQWVVGEQVRSFQCQPGRGQQDFSTELCN